MKRPVKNDRSGYSDIPSESLMWSLVYLLFFFFFFHSFYACMFESFSSFIKNKLRHCEFEKCTEVTETRNGKLVFNTRSAMAVILGPNCDT